MFTSAFLTFSLYHAVSVEFLVSNLWVEISQTNDSRAANLKNYCAPISIVYLFWWESLGFNGHLEKSRFLFTNTIAFCLLASSGSFNWLHKNGFPLKKLDNIRTFFRFKNTYFLSKLQHATIIYIRCIKIWNYYWLFSLSDARNSPSKRNLWKKIIISI